MSVQATTDNIESLAISMHSQPSVFALLLGSGVSRGADVLTGWEVVSHLIPQIAAMRNESCGSDPAQWYRACFGDDPSYSEILKKLGPTASDRKSILKTYFESTEEDREQGLKQPSEAHLAIAELVALGYVKVIITTNFDRLIENAISQAGVEPVVLSTDDDFAKAEPLAHMRCCVIKLHGDYLDPDTLNTEEELSNYGDKKQLFLERAIADYGLVVCGWSADWDEALRVAMASNVSQHYSTYWHVFREASKFSEDCISSRSARKIEWGTADELFSRLRDHVLALEEYTQQPHENVGLATATYKRLLAEDRYRIRLHDYTKGLVQEVNEAATRITPPSLIKEAPNPQSVEPLREQLESVSSKLVNCAFIAGQWLEPEHVHMWHLAFQRFAHCETGQYDVSEWHQLRLYPAMLTLHALCMGAILGNRYESMTEILHLTVSEIPFYDKRIAAIPEYVHSSLDRYYKYLEPYEHVYDFAFNSILDANYLVDQFETLHAETEILQILAQSPLSTKYPLWKPVGRFKGRQSLRSDIIERIRSSIETLGSESQYVNSGLFGDSSDLCLKHLMEFENRI